MIEKKQKRSSKQTQHPTEEKVLLLVDGELNPEETGAIRVHLRECCECQAKLRRLLKGISTFAEYRQESFLSR